jgi:hypothetical protein
MRHHWITKFAKIDPNQNNNVSLNTFASNMGPNTSHANGISNNNSKHNDDSVNQTTVIANNSTAINTNQMPNLTTSYIMKSASISSSSTGILPSQTKTNTVTKTNNLYASSIYSNTNNINPN